MLKVLLINPPQTCYKGHSFTTYFPLGLLYVAATVKDICQVQIFDCLLSKTQSRNGDTVTYGASSEEIKSKITNTNPDVIGASVPSTMQYNNTERVAIIAKQVNPKVTVVFGGCDPSARFKQILENKYCDYCVVGEGEVTFREFILSYPQVENVRGLAYRRNGEVHYTPRGFITNLDTLPYPALDLVDVNKYLEDKFVVGAHDTICKNSIAVMSSRGCPFSCVFCAVKLHMGNKHRAHSPEYVLQMLRFFRDKYGITKFHFNDDNLTFDKKRIETILSLIKNEGFKWDTPGGLRVDTLSYNLLWLMKEAGCIRVCLAIESGNQRVLDNVIKKKTNLAHALEVVRFCKDLGIEAQGFYVIGCPGETVQEMRETASLALDLYHKYELFPGLMVATPLYGTELFHECLEKHYINGEPDCVNCTTSTVPRSSIMISTPEFSPSDIQCIVEEFMLGFHRERMRFMLKHLRYSAGWLKRKITGRMARMVG